MSICLILLLHKNKINKIEKGQCITFINNKQLNSEKVQTVFLPHTLSLPIIQIQQTLSPPSFKFY